MFSVGIELVAPGEFGAIKRAARRIFPLGLGRQLLAGPRRVCERIRESDMHDRVYVQLFDVALRPARMTPACAFEERPPLAPVSQIDWTIWRCEDKRAGKKQMRQRSRIVLWIGAGLGECLVPGG